MDVSLQEKHCRLSARASHQGQDGSPKPSLRLPRRPHQLVRITSYGCLVLVLFILCLTVLPTVSAAGSCSTNLYSCPNCGGINVTDCLQCDGFLNTDPNAKQCYTRALFTDTPTYNTLWRDIVGTFVWFLAAGVATACGVGGGGIYVPLGMLLLGFAPKPASGLSQASIFGASLGGLLLNIRDFHPNTEITMKSGHKEQQNDNDNGDNNVQQQPSNDEDASSSSNNNNQELKSYTRPLIDYNMALFLAPLEMAGAVLGVLIQKVLPNWLYLTLAAIILAFTAYKTYKKWWSTRATERKKAAAAAASAAQEDEQEQEIETPNEEANASLHTKHVRSNPNVRKVDWSAPSEMYLYPSSDNLEPPKDGGDENADKQWTGSVGGNNMSIDGNQQATIGEDGDEEQDNTESNVHSVGSTSSKAHDDSFHDSSHASGRNSNNEDEDPTKTESSATSSNGGRSLREQCIQWLEKDARQYPREKLLALLVLWIGLILLTFMKGGKGVDSIVGITCESPWYGVLIAIQFLWTLGFALVFGLKLVKEQKAKEACGYPFLEYDVLWDNAKLRFYAFFTFCAGIVAGLIGVGGGMVLGPLMLVMGIHPRVSSATTGTMIVLTSSSVAVLFVTSGLVPWQYAIYFFCICLVGAFVGKKYIDGYVKRSGKASILIFLLATIIALATAGCIVIVLTRLAAANWCIEGFQPFCVAGSKDDGDMACATFLNGTQRFLEFLPEYHTGAVDGSSTYFEY